MTGRLGIRPVAFAGQSRSVAADRLELRGQPAIAQLQGREGGARQVVPLPPFGLDARPGREGLRHGRGDPLGRRQIGHRGIDVGPGTFAARRRLGRTGRDLVPAGVRIEQERRGQLLADRGPAGLLFGLGGKPSDLGSKLGEDVLDTREVRLRLDELLLRLAPAALVATDAGDLFEEGPAFLGAQRQGLVDHALADEQERVVGQVRRIEEVDQVAQPDPLFVEEILVLARAIQPAAELQDLEVDRQETVRVVDDERDVRHPLGRSPFRAGPDDILGLARA